MKTVDSLAKKGANSDKEPLISFTSRSAALSNLEVKALKRWKLHIEDNPFSENSGSYEALLYLHPHLHPPKWWKKNNCPIMNRLTQFASGHGYTGEYFKRFNVPHPTDCPCSLSGLYPPVLHSRSHILRACPLFEASRVTLRTHAPRIDNPKWPIGKLLLDNNIEHLLNFLNDSRAFSKGTAPIRQAKDPAP